MAAGELGTYQRKRLNPFKGLVIDVPIWSDAHNYHRDQQRLHAMSSHQPGIVTGLEVVAWNPPDNSVVVYPGVAIDHEGNTIVLAQPQRFYLKVEEPGMARIIIRYSEIVPDMAAKPVKGKPQPAYITEAFRIEEQRQRPAEPYIELARLDIADKSSTIKDPGNPHSPSHNELDMRHRTVSSAKPAGEIAIGILSHRAGRVAAGWDSHRQGVLNLVQSIQQSTAYAARMVDAIDLSSEILDCDLLCLTGYGEFQFSEGERQFLTNYFKRGGILFAEPCRGTEGQHQDQLKSFRTSFAGLCDKLGHPLHTLERAHPVFHSCHTFGAPPPGQDGNAMILGNESIIFSDADYGCVWQGGRNSQPLPRQVIRDAMEFGANIAAYACQEARLQAIRIMGG